MRFTKMHGLGNDYVYVDARTEHIENPPDIVRKISDRHTGIGSDGLIIIHPSSVADVRMEMYNADGSRGRMCGNGIRCVAKYAVEHDFARGPVVRVETDSGIKECECVGWPRFSSTEPGAKVITHVEWTSPLPPAVGTTRTVTMRGGLLGSEEFLLWEPYKRMGFRFNEASEKSIRAFAERYDVVATAAGCRLTWTLALDVAGPGRLFMPLSGLASNLAFRWFLRRLRAYTDARFNV